MPSRRSWRGLVALGSWLGAVANAAAALPTVPEEFEVRLVATVPTVEYPCQLATAPDGSLFVAEDPMDQSGVGPYEADHGRILRFRDGKDPVVFADGFRAIFGMAWHDGALYVMNMPRLTVLRDTDGDGKADRQAELFTDLGPKPLPNKLNDHIVSGLQFGMDGWLYVSVGDKGIPLAHGPDGRTVTLQGGGIVRCRPDGTGLEIYSSGTRNHLEPNLNDRDDLFTYDNTDDGNGWWTRVTHHIDGGYYGYPFDYHQRTDRMLPRIAEYGGGSPCGGVVYKEDAWPEKYRGRVLWGEWGKRQVPAFRFRPKGATFEVEDMIPLVEPTKDLDMRPIDLALSYDGRTLYVADWSAGWGEKEKLGRIFAVTPRQTVPTRPRGSDADPIEAQLEQLDHPSFNERMRAQTAIIKSGEAALPVVVAALADPKTDPVARRHLIWAIDGIAGGTPEASLPLIEALKSPLVDLRAQAARALGQRAVPIAVEPLVGLLKDVEPTARLQAVIALGRIGDPKSAPSVLPVLADEDFCVAFGARQALRRIGDWKAIADGLASGDAKVRDGVLLTLEEVYQPSAATALAEYVADSGHPADERAKALGFLAHGHRKARPWDGTWWSIGPARGKPPAKVIDWEGTPLASLTVRWGLDDPQAAVRLAAVRAVAIVGDRPLLRALHGRFTAERDATVLKEIVRTFGEMRDVSATPLLAAALREPRFPEAIRDAALASIEAIGSDAATGAIVELLGRDDLPADRQPRLIAALGKLKATASLTVLVEKLADSSATVRAAAASALGQIGRVDGVAPALRPLVDDGDLSVRKAAIVALGTLKDRGAIATLSRAAEAEPTRYEATMALAAMPDLRALPAFLRGLAEKGPELRRASAAALVAIRDPAATVLDQLAARGELSTSLLPELRKVYEGFQPLVRWQVVGPFEENDTTAIPTDRPVDLAARFHGKGGATVAWKPTAPVNDKGAINLGRVYNQEGGQFAFGYAEIDVTEAQTTRLAVGSDDTITLWLNGEQVFDFKDNRGFEAERDKVEVRLIKGVNRVLVRCGNGGGPWMFSVARTAPAAFAFLKSSTAVGGFDPDAFREFALKASGDVARGRNLFHDPKALACIKCHNVGGQGGAIGPELSSVGAKYPRDELIAAVLYPSAKLSQGYEPVTIATNDGRVLAGIVTADTPEAIEIADADAKVTKVPKADIDERKPGEVSIMPAGLAEGLNRQDFADLIAYLETLKQAGPGSGGAAAGGR